MLPSVWEGMAPSRRCLEFRPESLNEKFWSKLPFSPFCGQAWPANLTSDCGAPAVADRPWGGKWERVPLSHRLDVAAAASRIRSFIGLVSLFCRFPEAVGALTSTVESPSVGWMGAVETKGLALDVRPRGRFSGILAIFPRLVGKWVFAAILRKIERLTGCRLEMKAGEEMLIREHVDLY